MWKCASHQANLLCALAVCGSLSADKKNDSTLCGTLTRMYKYIFPYYILELTWSLRQYVQAHFKLVVEEEPSEETMQHKERTQRLLELYGEDILPDDLLAVKNRDIANMEHVARPDGVSEAAAMEAMIEVLRKLVLISQERPVVTRFFLFTPCCFAMLRMFIAGLPFEALSFGRLNPESENAKRVAAVNSYFRSQGASVEVRRVSLCLRLPSTRRA